MRKILLTLVAGTFLMFSANAQSVSAGIEIDFPTGNFGDVAGTGFGATGKIEFPFMPKVSFTGTAGFILFGGDEITAGTYSTEYSYTAIPLMGGAKLSLAKGLYVFADAGLHMLFFSFDQTYPDPFTGQTVTTSDSDSEIEFGLAIGSGYEYPIAPMMDLDVSAKYQLVTGDASYFSVRAGLKFGL